MVCEVMTLLLEFLEGLGLCICVLMLELISFVLSCGGSVSLALALAAIINGLWHFEVPIFSIAIFQGFLLIAFATLSTFYETVLLGAQLTRGIARFPIFLGLIPVFVTLTLSVVAIYEIYFQSFNYHSQGKENLSDVVDGSEGTPGTGEKKAILPKTVLLLTHEDGLRVAQFIVAFSYLIYNSAKAIKADLANQLIAFHHITPHHQQFATVVGTFFLSCQFGLTVAYFIPLFYFYVLINYLIVDKGTLFFYICIIGVSLGFFASFLESKKPFPQVKGIQPLYPFEVNVKARIWLLEYVLLPFVYFYFFKYPLHQGHAMEQSPQLPPSKHNNSEESDKNILFTLLFALLLLHTVKILSISMFISRINENQRIRRRRRRQRERGEALAAAAVAMENLLHIDEQDIPIRPEPDDQFLVNDGGNAGTHDLNPTIAAAMSDQETGSDSKNNNNNNANEDSQGLGMSNPFSETHIEIEKLGEEEETRPCHGLTQLVERGSSVCVERT